MTGVELYRLYMNALIKRDIEIDGWIELSDEDQDAWDEVAIKTAPSDDVIEMLKQSMYAVERHSPLLYDRIYKYLEKNK